MSKASVLIPHKELRRLTGAIFLANGLAANHAALVADTLIWANLRGVDSHGVQRVPRYVEWLQSGTINPTPTFEIEQKTPSSFILDADRSAGPIAMTAAMEHAVQDADKAGISFGLIRHTTHVAAVGYYTKIAAQHDMAGIAISASVPNMAYHGARAAGVATNPLAIAVPGRNGRIVSLDMATAVAALGKLMHARSTSTPVPDGWALDADGDPTNDPMKATLPRPLGGPKGAGLSLAFECLTSLLAGQPIISDMLTGGDKRHRQNAAVVAINISTFTDVETFKNNVEELSSALKSLPRAADVDEILLPGERGDRVHVQRERDGIPVPVAIWSKIVDLAETYDLPVPVPIR